MSTQAWRGAIEGQGPTVEALARAADAIGPEGAGVTSVWVAPLTADLPRDPLGVMEALFHRPLRLIEALAATASDPRPAPLPDPRPDLMAEPVAGQHLLLVVERHHLQTGSDAPLARAAIAALLAYVEEASLLLAPHIRINVLALPLAAPPDLAPSLRWLTGRAVVTGQVVRLGAPAPSSAPFRSGSLGKPL